MSENNNDEIGEKILEQILLSNPNLKRGDDMEGPIALVTYGGKIVTDDNFEGDSVVIKAECVNYLLPREPGTNTFVIDGAYGYLHYYKCYDRNEGYVFRFSISNDDMVFTNKKITDISFV